MNSIDNTNTIIDYLVSKNGYRSGPEKAFILSLFSALDVKIFIDKCVDWSTCDSEVLHIFKTKMSYDLCRGIGLREYEEYFSSAVKKMYIVGHKETRRLVSFISLHINYFSSETQQYFLDFCINSKNRNYRNKAWRNSELVVISVDKLMEIYSTYKDPEIILLLFDRLGTDNFVSFVEDNSENVLEMGWIFRKVYRELHRHYSQEFHDKVMKYDPVTYLYSSVVNRIDLSDKLATDLFKRSENKEFALWCLGKLRKIEVVCELYNNRELVNEDNKITLCEKH